MSFCNPCMFFSFIYFINFSMSPVFRKVGNLSEEESVYHTKISRVQQGIDGKAAEITCKWSFFILSLDGLVFLKLWGNESSKKRLMHTENKEYSRFLRVITKNPSTYRYINLYIQWVWKVFRPL